MSTLQKLVRVRRAVPLENLTMRLEFEDGSVKVKDLSPLMRGPIFDELRQDDALFAAVMVEHGTLTWPNGADIDPDVLYYDLAPSFAEESASAS